MAWCLVKHKDNFTFTYYTLIRAEAIVKVLWKNIMSIIDFSNIRSGLSEFGKQRWSLQARDHNDVATYTFSLPPSASGH
jgi:hypothetical protein